jgi:PAS domain S-box-containing protein
MSDEPALEGAEHSERAAAAFHLAAIVDSSDDAIVSKDLNGTVRTWNRGAERLFGYRADEMVGRSIRTIIPADRQAEEDEVLRRIRSGLRVDHFETIRCRKDGALVEISLTVSPVRNDEGKIIGASKIARDISKQKALEAALRAAIEVKDEFLSMVSHELRTPISVIVGNGHLLLRRREMLSEEEQLRSLTDITEQGERLRRITENLLALTRLEAGDAPELLVIDFDAIAHETVEAFRQREPRREIQLQSGASLALGDHTSAGLVFENLISNALKYSPADSAVEVVTSVDVSGRPTAEVLDRGIGLTDEEITVIFEPFYRSRAAVRTAGGMGLGLAVCKRLVEAQGGEIWAAVRPGGGSIFGFCLPPAGTGWASEAQVDDRAVAQP